jgi:hypothetical protein
MIDGIKTEKDVDVQSEEDSTVTEMGDVHIPSTFSVQEAELEVSYFEIVFALLFMWVCSCGLL